MVAGGAVATGPLISDTSAPAAASAAATRALAGRTSGLNGAPGRSAMRRPG
jgi:hypothetical protein